MGWLLTAPLLFKEHAAISLQTYQQEHQLLVNKELDCLLASLQGIAACQDNMNPRPGMKPAAADLPNTKSKHQTACRQLGSVTICDVKSGFDQRRHEPPGVTSCHSKAHISAHGQDKKFFGPEARSTGQ